MINSILIVCTANICRSPMAEAFFSKALTKEQIGITITSAGIRALDGYPVDPMIESLMKERNYDLSSHRSKQLNAEHLQVNDLILVMDQPQKKYLETIMPAIRGRIHLLGKWRNLIIEDPFKKTLEKYLQVINDVEVSVLDWIDRIWGNKA